MRIRELVSHGIVSHGWEFASGQNSNICGFCPDQQKVFSGYAAILNHILSSHGEDIIIWCCKMDLFRAANKWTREKAVEQKPTYNRLGIHRRIDEEIADDSHSVQRTLFQ